MPEATFNRITLLGHLARDPEIRSLDSGDQVATFAVATTDTWKNRACEPQERGQFHPAVIWNQALIEATVPHLKKGSSRPAGGRTRAPQLRSRARDALLHRSRAAALQRLDRDARSLPGAAGGRADTFAANGAAPEVPALKTHKDTQSTIAAASIAALLSLDRRPLTPTTRATPLASRFRSWGRLFADTAVIFSSLT